MKTLKNIPVILIVPALALLMISMIWASYFRQQAFDKKEALEYAIEKNSNLAKAFEQYTISTLHNADAVLRLVRAEYAHEGNNLDLHQLLDESLLNRNIEGVCVINNRGKLVMSNIDHPGDAEMDVSDRAYFIFHSKSHKDSLLISKPLVSRSIGKPVIIISRRLNDPKGNFSGVVALQLQPSAFTSFYAQAKLLPNDIMSLISPDGITYARRTGNKESSGEDIHLSPLFVNVANNADSFYYAPDAIRHVPTWFSYCKLKNYPIIATVGSSEQDILTDFANKQARFKLPRIITSVLIILFSLLIGQILIHRKRTANRLLEEKQRYEHLLTEQMIAVQERERERIGRELHDNVNQVLTSVKLYLDLASHNSDDPLIPRSIKLIDSSISDIRNLSHQLSAPTLGTRSLIDSVNALIETIHSSTGILFEFDHSGYHVSLAMSEKLALYRILQEQVNNIIKHANASKIWISLLQKQEKVILTVRDNGRGFDSRVKSNGMGLNNIASRVKVFDGSVDIKTAPRKGCLLSVTMPIVVSEEGQSV